MRELEGINSLAFDGLEFGRGSHGWNQKKIMGSFAQHGRIFGTTGQVGGEEVQALYCFTRAHLRHELVLKLGSGIQW